MRIPAAIISCCYTTLLAAEPTGKELAPLGIQSLLETAGGLILILVLIIGGAWLFKRLGRLPMAGKGLVTVLGGVSVGPRERVVLLKVDDARLVVGVAPGQVRTLHVMDPAEPEEASFEARLADVRRSDGGVTDA
jgi:flagellar protein FliO/FliZ